MGFKNLTEFSGDYFSLTPVFAAIQKNRPPPLKKEGDHADPSLFQRYDFGVVGIGMGDQRFQVQSPGIPQGNSEIIGIHRFQKLNSARTFHGDAPLVHQGRVITVTSKAEQGI